MSIPVRAVRLAVVVAVLAGVGVAHAARPTRTAGSNPRVAQPHRARTVDIDRRIDINNINMFVTNYGAFAYDIGGNYNGGLFFPNHTSKTAVYAAGLWLGAQIGGTTTLAVAEYDQEYRPGRIVGGVPEPPGNPDLVVYKVLPWKGVPADTGHVDNPNANFDAGEDPLVHHSWSEYMAHAVPYGAPWKIWTLPGPTAVPGPDVLGDQMLWCVYNDADGTAHTNEAGGTGPLGVQIDQTTWAYDRTGPLGNMVFIKYKITNGGSNTLDNMFVSQWADPDLGNFTDDLVGCDTVPDFTGKSRSMGFVYNGNNHDAIYGDIPPALGIDFLQGPTNAVGDTLGLTSFAKYINGTDPLSSGQTYDWMQGLDGNNAGAPIVDPYGVTTHFMVAGDPLLPLPTSWLDSNPADRRFFLSSGPIQMLPGQTQTVIVAIVVGECGDRLSSIKALRFNDDQAQQTYNDNFVLPPAVPPPTPIATGSADHGQVTLRWDDAPLTATYAPGYTFEGWHVYQGGSIAGPWKLVAVYDSVNTITEVYDKAFTSNCEVSLASPLAHGINSGLKDFHVATNDLINGTTLKDGTDYYYGVAAYCVNTSATENRVLESSFKAVDVRPQRLTSAVAPSMVRAVPNPYYAHSAYEQNQFSRKIRFLNCPAQCTIRIYNLAGQLVRTLTKNDPTTSVVEWDVQTANDLPVGSGIYIAHVDSPAGASIVRVVVFMEKERLNNF
jgi:hypothetical protein